MYIQDSIADYGCGYSVFPQIIACSCLEIPSIRRHLTVFASYSSGCCCCHYRTHPQVVAATRQWNPGSRGWIPRLDSYRQSFQDYSQRNGKPKHWPRQDCPWLAQECLQLCHLCPHCFSSTSCRPLDPHCGFDCHLMNLVVAVGIDSAVDSKRPGLGAEYRRWPSSLKSLPRLWCFDHSNRPNCVAPTSLSRNCLLAIGSREMQRSHFCHRANCSCSCFRFRCCSYSATNSGGWHWRIGAHCYCCRLPSFHFRHSHRCWIPLDQGYYCLTNLALRIQSYFGLLNVLLRWIN